MSSTGLPSRGDRLHFSTNGSRELGIRYAKKLLDIVTSSKPSLSRQSVAKSEPPVVLRKNKEPQRSTSPADRAKQSTLPSTLAPPSAPLEVKMHIYILAGASNMVGRDKPMSGDQFNQTHDNVFAMTEMDVGFPRPIHFTVKVVWDLESPSV